MNRSTLALKALVAAAALAVPVGLAMPASASTYSNGCTVAPQRPYANGTIASNGRPNVNYEVDVTCVDDVTVTIYMERWEDDPNQVDDLIGTSTLTSNFSGGAGSLTRTVTGNLPDTDDFTDQYEEMYQRVRFKVTSGTVTSPLTAWEYSSIRSIHT